MKSHHVDLLNEAIAPALTRLALPIMATSLVQMLYNLTDMAWIGRLGAGAVTAVTVTAPSGWYVYLVFTGICDFGEDGRSGKDRPLSWCGRK